MRERIKFILEWERRWHEKEGRVNMTALCLEFGISRECGYKWLRRYRQGGEDIEALREGSRRPRTSPTATTEKMVDVIVRTRKKYPYWGPKKLHTWLLPRFGAELPSASTIGDILKRHGLTRPRRRRRRVQPDDKPFRDCNDSNHVWCVDFKGHFRTGDGRRVYPLTLLDAHSRFLLRCEALTQPTADKVAEVFKSVFKDYGLPLAIRSDNGPPFASRAAGGLTELSAWWISLGIKHERIQPGHPEQNGRQERFHRTLKQETASHPRASLRAQQRAFDRFRRLYNEERPHQALGQRTPSSLYDVTGRPWKDDVLDYPFADCVKELDDRGVLQWGRRRIFVNQHLAGRDVGLWIMDDGRWQVFFGPVLLGYIDRSRPHQRLLPPRKKWKKVSAMSSD